MARTQSWGLQEGDEIANGRSVLKLLGGGHLYEVYLVWDDKLFAVMVAKLLRPDLADDEGARRGLAREAEALARLAHPVLLRGFDALLEGDFPHVLVEHLEGPTLRRLIKRTGPLPASSCCPWRSTSRRPSTTSPARAWCTSTSSPPTSSWESPRG